MPKNYDEIEARYRDLIAHIDTMITELTQMRDEVAAAVERSEEVVSVPMDGTDSEVTESDALSPETGDKLPSEETPIEVADQSSDSEVRGDTTDPQHPSTEEETASSEAKLSAATASVDPILEEKVPELTLETAFEPLIDFHTSGHLSVADSFLFANELFLGNRPALVTALSEIDRLSSMTQLRHYLYDTLRLDEEDEAVQHFYDFIVAHSSRR